MSSVAAPKYAAVMGSIHATGYSFADRYSAFPQFDTLITPETKNTWANQNLISSSAIGASERSSRR